MKIIEETYSIWHGKRFLTEFDTNDFGEFNCGEIRDICEIVGRDH